MVCASISQTGDTQSPQAYPFTGPQPQEARTPGVRGQGSNLQLELS